MTRHTATMPVEELSLSLVDERKSRHESMTGVDFEVEVSFDYTPAVPAKLSGPMEDAEEGEPAQLEICSIKLCKATNFNAVCFNLWVSKGTEMIAFFKSREIEKMEEALLAKQGDKNV